MGNKQNSKSKEIKLASIFEENSFYKYDVETDVFQLEINFLSYKGAQTSLFQISFLSSIQNEILRTEEKKPPYVVITTKIEGTLANIGYFAEKVFVSDILRPAFLEVSKMELMKNGSSNLIWDVNRKPFVRFFDCKKGVIKEKQSPQKNKKKPLKKQEDLQEEDEDLSPMKVPVSNVVFNKQQHEEKKGEELLLDEVFHAEKKIEPGHHSGDNLMREEASFQNLLPKKTFLARFFGFDFYKNKEKNSFFSKYQPISMLMKHFYPDCLEELIVVSTKASENTIKITEQMAVVSGQITQINDKLPEIEKKLGQLPEIEKKLGQLSEIEKKLVQLPEIEKKLEDQKKQMEEILQIIKGRDEFKKALLALMQNNQFVSTEDLHKLLEKEKL